MAQGLAFAVDLPVVPVSTLAALAQQGLRTHQSTQVLSAIDARMDEVYWGAFTASDGLMVPVAPEVVVAPQNVAAVAGVWFGMGTGWAFREQMAAKVIDCQSDAWPHARDIATLAAADVKQGKAVPAEQAMPVYLRDKVALKKSER